MQKTIAAFDFDGTITTKDTMFDFIRFVKGNIAFYVGLLWLLPMLVLYKMGYFSNQQAKEKMLRYFLGGMKEKDLYDFGKKYAANRIPSLIREKAQARIAWHKSEKHDIFLVTASLTFWTKAWAEANGFILVASLPEIENDIFTGKIRGKNCHGEEKVLRLKAQILDTLYYKRFAYGDTSGDKELLEWADEGAYRAFE